VRELLLFSLLCAGNGLKQTAIATQTKTKLGVLVSFYLAQRGKNKTQKTSRRLGSTEIKPKQGSSTSVEKERVGLLSLH